MQRVAINKENSFCNKTLNVCRPPEVCILNGKDSHLMVSDLLSISNHKHSLIFNWYKKHIVRS